MEFKMNKLKQMSVTSVLMLSVIGCSNTSKSEISKPVPEPKDKRSLNQPELAKLEPVVPPAAATSSKTAAIQKQQPNMDLSYTQILDEVPTGTISKGMRSSDGSQPPSRSLKAKQSTVGAQNAKAVSVDVQKSSNSTDEGAKSNVSDKKSDKTEIAETRNFLLYEGELYKTALFRWLNKEGYTKVGTLLNSDAEALLSAKVTESQLMTTTFTQAINRLISSARSETVYAKNGKEIDQDVLKKLYIDVRLDKNKAQAVVTSTKMPTYMFMVEKGSLLENYLKLGRAYKWEAREEFFLGKNWSVDFSYPIVTEEGNVKSALEQLLSQYKDMRGGVVPSVRQIFVYKDSSK